MKYNQRVQNAYGSPRAHNVYRTHSAPNPTYSQSAPVQQGQYIEGQAPYQWQTEVQEPKGMFARAAQMAQMQSRPELGAALYAEPPQGIGGVEHTSMPPQMPFTNQPVMPDFSGASGNPFAQAARQAGFNDFTQKRSPSRRGSSGGSSKPSYYQPTRQATNQPQNKTDFGSAVVSNFASNAQRSGFDDMSKQRTQAQALRSQTGGA